MTRKEAILYMYLYRQRLVDSVGDLDKDIKAYDMAIEALEQEPCEDCIARQPLIDNWNSCADMLMGEGDAEIVMGWIFDAPSVIPKRNIAQEPETGYWIRFDKNKLKCSKCEVIHLIAQYPHGKIDWCPNCGTRMKAVKE